MINAKQHSKMLDLSVPLYKGRYAKIYVPFPMSKKDYLLLIGFLELSKCALTEQDEDEDEEEGE